MFRRRQEEAVKEDDKLSLYRIHLFASSPRVEIAAISEERRVVSATCWEESAGEAIPVAGRGGGGGGGGGGG
eukprot:763985-Hanusia_phi.AAC.1